MNRAQIAYEMLKLNQVVKMGDIPNFGTLNVYTARNAFSEAKKLALADGYSIIHEYGKGFCGNSYRLVKSETSGKIAMVLK